VGPRPHGRAAQGEAALDRAPKKPVSVSCRLSFRFVPNSKLPRLQIGGFSSPARRLKCAARQERGISRVFSQQGRCLGCRNPPNLSRPRPAPSCRARVGQPSKTRTSTATVASGAVTSGREQHLLGTGFASCPYPGPSLLLGARAAQENITSEASVEWGGGLHRFPPPACWLSHG